jgi:hypothetical protein
VLQELLLQVEMLEPRKRLLRAMLLWQEWLELAILGLLLLEL